MRPARLGRPIQDESQTWRGAVEANAIREFLGDTIWGELDVLFLDLPPGTDRLTTITSLTPTLTGIIVVTIPSEVSQLVRRSVTVAVSTRAPVLGLVENMAGLFPGRTPPARRRRRDPVPRERAVRSGALHRGRPGRGVRVDLAVARVDPGLEADRGGSSCGPGSPPGVSAAAGTGRPLR